MTAPNDAPNIVIYDAHIDWRYPPIRNGFMGIVDKIAGPGYTAAEVALLWFYGLSFLIMIAVHNYVHQTTWTFWQHFTSVFLAVNMGFGVVVSSSPLKRWYHRNGTGITGLSLGMVIFEAVFETAIANWAFFAELGSNWNFFWAIGGLSSASFVLSTWTPLYLKRPMNIGLYMFQIFLATYYLPKVQGMEWYTYVIFTKYLSHLPRSEISSFLPLSILLVFFFLPLLFLGLMIFFLLLYCREEPYRPLEETKTKKTK